MVTQEQESVDELHLVYKIVVSLRDDVKDVKEQCDGLSKQVGEFAAYVIRAKTQEEERQLPMKFNEHDKRISELEKREHQRDGQVKMIKWLAALASFIGAILGIWLAIRQLSGK